MACARQPAAAAPRPCWCCATTRGWTTPRSPPASAFRPPRSPTDGEAGLGALRSILRRRGRPEDLLPAALADPARDLPVPAGPDPAGRPGAIRAGAAAPLLAGPRGRGRRRRRDPRPGARSRLRAGDPRQRLRHRPAARLAGPRLARRRRGPAALRPAGLAGRRAGGAAAHRAVRALRRPSGRRPGRAAAGHRLAGLGWVALLGGGAATRPRSSCCAGPSRSAAAAPCSRCGRRRRRRVRLLGPPGPPTAAACSSATRGWRRTRRCAGSPLDAGRPQRAAGAGGRGAGGRRPRRPRARGRRQRPGHRRPAVRARRHGGGRRQPAARSPAPPTCGRPGTTTAACWPARLGGPVVVAPPARCSPPRSASGAAPAGRRSRAYEVRRGGVSWFGTVLRVDGTPVCVDTFRLGPVGAPPRLPVVVRRCLPAGARDGLVHVVAEAPAASVRVRLLPRRGQRQRAFAVTPATAGARFAGGGFAALVRGRRDADRRRPGDGVGRHRWSAGWRWRRRRPPPLTAGWAGRGAVLGDRWLPGCGPARAGRDPSPLRRTVAG